MKLKLKLPKPKSDQNVKDKPIAPVPAPSTSIAEIVQQVPVVQRVELTPPPKIPDVPTVQMEFFDRMDMRRQLNPFSIGINRIEHYRRSDYFYREILIRFNH